MPKERLELDISAALRAIAGIESQLVSAAGSFGTALGRALSQLDAVSKTTTFTADTTQAQEAVRQVGDETKKATEETEKWTDSLQGAKGALAAIGIAASAAGAFQLLKDAVLDASDLGEATNKARVIFEDSAGGVISFAEQASASIGLTRAEALGAAADFGTLFNATGVAGAEGARMSERMTTLAADLASINNIPIDEALLRLRAGLVGEAEPLRRIGILLNASAVESKALELGLADANGEVSEGAKLQARYALILAATTKQQGDFGRTADDLANAMRSARAEIGEARIALGAGLLSPATKFTLLVRDELAPTLAALFEPLGRIVGAFAEAGGVVLPVTVSLLRALVPLFEVLAVVLEQIPAPVLSMVLAFKTLSAVAGTSFGAGMKKGTVALAALVPLLGAIPGPAGEAAVSMASLAAIGFQIGGPWGAAIGAAVGLVTTLFGGAKDEAAELADSIKGIARASDEAVRSLARATAGWIAQAEAVSDGFGAEVRTSLIDDLKAMAREGDAGAGAAKRLGQEYVAAGIITEQQFTRILRNARGEQEQFNETVAEGAAIMAELPTSTEIVETALGSMGEELGTFSAAFHQAFGEDAVVTFDGFIAHLNAKVAEFAAWNDLIASLLAAGLADLAAVVQEAGPGSALATEVAAAEGPVREAWNKTAKGAVQGLADEQQLAVAQAAEITKKVVAEFDAGEEAAQKAGRRVGKSLGQGIEAGLFAFSDNIAATVRQVIRDAERAARDEAASQSPSKLFAAVGTDLVAGLEQGFASGAGAFKAEVAASISGAAAAPVAAPRAAAGPTVVVVRDLWEAESRGVLPGGTADQVSFLTGRS